MKWTRCTCISNISLSRLLVTELGNGCGVCEMVATHPRT